MFQEHPYIFTKVNSFPIPPTTTAPKTDSTAFPHSSSTTTPTTTNTTTTIICDCTNDVPVWLAAVLAVTGLLIGWGVTWLLLSCRAKRNKRLMTSAVEMKGTVF